MQTGYRKERERHVCIQVWRRKERKRDKSKSDKKQRKLTGGQKKGEHDVVSRCEERPPRSITYVPHPHIPNKYAYAQMYTSPLTRQERKRRRRDRIKNRR